MLSDRNVGWLDDETAGPGLLASVWQFRRQSVVIVAALVVVGLALPFAVNSLAAHEPSATAQLVLTDPRGDSVFRRGNSANTDLQKYAASRTQVVGSARVLQRTADRLGEEFDAGFLVNHVSASLSVESLTVLIRASAPTYAQAVRIADAVAAAYQDVTNEDVQAEADRALAALERSRSRLRSDSIGTQADPALAQALGQIELKATEIVLDAALFGGGVDFFDRAAPEARFSRRPLQYVVPATILGVLIAVIVAWTRAGWHKTVEASEHARAILRAPVLGDVPDIDRGEQRKLLTLPRAMPAAAFEAIAAALAAGGRERGVILVTAVSSGDGSTVTAASIAIAVAREGRKVVLVDADTEGRGAQSLLRAVPGPGLAELAGQLGHEAIAIQSIELGHGATLAFLPPGEAGDDLPSIFRSDGAKRVFAQLALDYDLVLVDAPPLLTSAQTASLSLHANAVLVVVRQRTPVQILEAFQSTLAIYPIPIAGVVFNRSRADGRRGRTTTAFDNVVRERADWPELGPSHAPIKS